MRDDELKLLFDKQAAGYDEQWAKTAPIREGLLFQVNAAFAELPADARILCVGTGTGEEMAYLAQRNPQWRFVAVEPSGAMLAMCRHKAEMQGFVARCYFHEGYLDTLPRDALTLDILTLDVLANRSDRFDAATCFLVSQFILATEVRTAFFRTIATRLRPGGILASSDLSADRDSGDFDVLLPLWLNTMASAGIPTAGLDAMRAAYTKDVAVLPPTQVAAIIEAGGFERPVRFYQAGLISAWLSKRAFRRGLIRALDC